MITVGIVGVTGYTGSELLRILIGHPEVSIQVVTSRTEKGKPVTDLFPHLRGHLDLVFQEPDPAQLQNCNLVFYATPNGTAMNEIPDLLSAGVKVIDLSADFRLKDASVWSEWYGLKHNSPQLLEQAVYGLPELNRDKIKKANLVANPGCYPTAICLGLLPLLESQCVDAGRIIADAKSGVSGAGRKSVIQQLHAEVSESFRAYGASGHRHYPEICQTLAQVIDNNIGLTFVPHLVPMIRGIHATIYVNKTGQTDVQQLFVNRYKMEPFIDILPPGSHPETRSVRGSNMCRIAIHEQKGSNVVVILSVIDNLVKGAAGQAIQNMNLMFGIDEQTGLEQPALVP